jgi:hypothetical protein
LVENEEVGITQQLPSFVRRTFVVKGLAMAKREELFFPPD